MSRLIGKTVMTDKFYESGLIEYFGGKTSVMFDALSEEPKDAILVLTDGSETTLGEYLAKVKTAIEIGTDWEEAMKERGIDLSF